MVVELGDGLMGQYGVREILSDPAIQRASGAIVLAATDPVAAWGGAMLLDELGLAADVITGPATDNEAGCRSVLQRVSRTAVANARTQSEHLAEATFAALGLKSAGTPRLRAVEGGA